MGKPMSEVQYVQELQSRFNGEVKLAGRYKSLSAPVLLQDRYGVMYLQQANYIFGGRPSILRALNKTQYFMEMLKDVQPEIAKMITPVGEYQAMKTKMLFSTQYGLVSVAPDSLLHGHKPTVRCACNRKDYMQKQLQEIYKDTNYKFKLNTDTRKNGKITLVCPIHGEVLVDSDWIFEGRGCPECNKGAKKSNLLYVIKMMNTTESFYKVGVTYYDKKGTPRRFHDYKKLGYQVEVLNLMEFETVDECLRKETELKRIIKNNTYLPQNWPNANSTECFTEPLVELLIKSL